MHHIHLLHVNLVWSQIQVNLQRAANLQKSINKVICTYAGTEVVRAKHNTIMMQTSLWGQPMHFLTNILDRISVGMC